jgi:hypothetical protein
MHTYLLDRPLTLLVHTHWWWLVLTIGIGHGSYRTVAAAAFPPVKVADRAERTACRRGIAGGTQAPLAATARLYSSYSNNEGLIATWDFRDEQCLDEDTPSQELPVPVRSIFQSQVCEKL